MRIFRHARKVRLLNSFHGDEAERVRPNDSVIRRAKGRLRQQRPSARRGRIVGMHFLRYTDHG
jgi:hypothetical protein